MQSILSNEQTKRNLVSPDGRTLTLCCGVQGCPKVEKQDDGGVKITDDHGGSVQLSKDEWGMLINQLKTEKF